MFLENVWCMKKLEAETSALAKHSTEILDSSGNKKHLQQLKIMTGDLRDSAEITP